MPPRHAYWTILVDNQPTAFRAHDPEELQPTLNRLREKNDTAIMKWFERGQLFDSREAAKEAGLGKGERRWEGPRPERREDEGRRSGPREDRGPREERRPREDRGPRKEWGRRDERGPREERAAREDRGPREERAAREDRGAREERPRDKKWRPGGEHRDPRQKYKDAKKAKWGRFKQNIRDRHEERMARRDPETFTPPHGDKLRARPKWGDRREDSRRTDYRGEDTRRFDRGPREDRPSRPHGDKFGDQRPRDERPRSFGDGGRDRDERPREPGFKKKPFGSKPAGPRKPWGAKPGGSSRPAGGSSRPRGPSSSRPPAGGGPVRRSFSEGGSRNRKPAGPRRRRDEED